jgi:hypothetical protein
MRRLANRMNCVRNVERKSTMLGMMSLWTRECSMGIVGDLQKDLIGSTDMLIVLVHNDSTGTEESANYNVEVRANYQTLFTTRIEGHNRKHGWVPLLAKIVAVASREEIEKGVTKSAI